MVIDYTLRRFVVLCNKNKKNEAVCDFIYEHVCVCFLRGTPFSFSVRCLRSLAQRADKSEGTQCLKIKVSARVPDS